MKPYSAMQRAGTVQHCISYRIHQPGRYTIAVTRDSDQAPLDHRPADVGRSAAHNADEGAVLPAPAGPSTSNTQKVYQELRRLIIAGDIPPASKLKIEELKLRLSAGASPIREALSLLTSDQLVERLDQRGFRTAAVSRAHFLEILNLRCQLEGIALSASIKHGEIQWRIDLDQAMGTLANTSRQDPSRWEQQHKQFHIALIAACQSPILLRFCSQLYDLNIRYRNLAARATEYDQRNVNAEHQAIVDAALKGDTDNACQLLQDHYSRTGNYLSELLADIGVP